MKFLLDENLPPSLAIKLKSIGYVARHIQEIGYNNTSDIKITDFAESSGEIILTHDTDFGTILALSGREKPSVILFRWQVITVQNMFEFLEKYLPELEIELFKGSLILVDENKIRIRSLPLQKKNKE
jgi:predicted nuclease of predicted toxin-antitoxin system